MRIAWFGAGIVVALLGGLAALNVLPQERGLDHATGQSSAVDSPQFRREASLLFGFTVTDGNAVTDLQNGEQMFPAMLTDIRAARSSIDLETYIFRPGRLADRFVAALSERARAGIKVHVVADWAGSRSNTDIPGRLRDAGVAFAYFRPLGWHGLDRLNNRTHRKLLVIDGRVAYTGGMGIDDAWMGNADAADEKRDMMFRVEGPAAAQMQAVFEYNWIIATGVALLGPRYFPALPPAGNMAVQTFASAPEGGREDMELMFLLAIDGARSSIDLEASYFIPDALTRDALLAAQARGVRVRVIVPGDHVDDHVPGDASRAGWGPFLRAGVGLYRFAPSLFHSKLMIVDDYLVLAGSGNIDDRSFRLNDEANVAIYDRGFATHMAGVFERDLRRSRQVTLRQWQQRPWTQKLADRFWALFGSQL
jgi:cardiolipin synthase